MKQIFSFITAMLAMVMICNAQANQKLSNLIPPTAINVGLIPGGTTGSKNLGSDTKRWRNGYFHATVYGYGNGSSYGVFGTSSTYGVYGTSGYLGVFGSGGSYGVYGSSSTGYGVTGTSSSNYGVYGSSGYLGVYGNGTTYGVYGQSDNNYGVYGYSTNYLGVFGY